MMDTVAIRVGDKDVEVSGPDRDGDIEISFDWWDGRVSLWLNKREAEELRDEISRRFDYFTDGR